MKLQQILLILVLFVFSCTSNDSDSIECSEQISFFEGGEKVTLPVSGPDDSRKAVYQFKDPSPFDPNKVSRAFLVRGGTLTKTFDVVLELNVDDETSCLPLGIYNSQTLDIKDGILSFAYISGFNFFTSALGMGQGILEITECDFERQTISGTFSCTLSDGTEEIRISDGEFTDVCFDLF